VEVIPVPLAVYDFRTDIRNVVVTPQIRGRFFRVEPGTVATRHSHDLGHEVFLILQGQCEFEIEGERAVLTPGQMCFAYAHQRHAIRVIGDEPVIMYLSVTPHIEPTHTHYDQATGQRLPPRYNPPTAFDQPAEPAPLPTEALADLQVDKARALAATAQTAAVAQAAHAEQLKAALATGDRAAAKAAMDGLWAQVYATFQSLNDLAENWNRLAPRASERA
jgi:quercetin dioxygenase-like cupin family protein